jgi:hypothetical protein
MLDILFYPMPVMNFNVMDKILPSTFLAIDVLEVIFIKGIDNDRSIIWNQNALAMWARAADRMLALLF